MKSSPVKLNVEIADTQSKHRTGLMFRKSLPDDAGMLFCFNKPEVLKFWGMNTYIPLDIAFVSPEMKIIKIDRIAPNSLKGISSEYPCDKAIEANLGFFEQNNITIGDSITVIKDNDGFDVVVFDSKK